MAANCRSVVLAMQLRRRRHSGVRILTCSLHFPKDSIIISDQTHRPLRCIAVRCNAVRGLAATSRGHAAQANDLIHAARLKLAEVRFQ